MKKMPSLLLPVALLLQACASKPPIIHKPKYIYMVLYGGKLRGYPYAPPTNPEITINANDLVGGMCLPIRDWEQREKDIMDLENYGWQK